MHAKQVLCNHGLSSKQLRYPFFTAMSLSDSPRETLLDIAELLDDAGMNALSRTNGQLYKLLNKHLYSRDLRSRGRSLLWAADNHEVEATVQLALAVGRNLDFIPESYHIALQVAADKGHVRLVQLLLEVEGINPNFGGGSLQCAPLILAAQRGHSAIVELLLAATKIDPNVRDLESNSPLFFACRNGYVSIVEQLLTRKDVDPNIPGFEETATPLTMACYHGHTDIVNLLLATEGIDVNYHMWVTPGFNKQCVGAHC